MKRLFLCIVLILCISVISFSQEIWFAGGTAFGNYFLNGEDFKSNYTGSLGINLNFYALNEKNIGIFFNYGILFPLTNSIGKGSDLSVQLDFIILGVGFGYDLSTNMKLYGGIGPNLNALFLNDSEGSDITLADYIIGLGIGGDVGIKYNVVNRMTINVGTTFAYNFAAYRIEAITIKEGDWTRSKENSGLAARYSMISIKPYIAIGFSIN